jgi:hypothetical protein
MINPCGVLLLVLAFQAEKPLSGIYIVQTPPRKVACPNEARMIVANQKICLSRNPIIAAGELTYATDIRYDPVYKEHYIDIGLSATGSNVLTQTNKSLPGARYALALEGRVICVFSVNPTISIRSFRIGNDIELKDLNTIHELLKQVKFN